MKKIRVSAPGKLHLLGEHVVVYGKPALLTAVNKRIFVEIESRKDKKIEIIFKKILRQAQDDKLVDYIKYAINTTAKFYNKPLPPHQNGAGLTLTISSEIPIGAGMGSSAASSVAIAGAVTLFLGQKFDKEKINEIAFLIEKYNHGNPSGGDNSASCYGGFIWYRKETESLKIIQPVSLNLSSKIAKNLFIINTGKAKKSTAEMVSLVKTFVKKNPIKAKKIFKDQELLTRNLLSVIEDNDENKIIQIIKDGERNLEKLGVVSSYAKKIIREIEKSGGAAKICGAGGKTKGAGIVLVYHEKRKSLESLLKSYNLSCSNITFGAEGVRIEK